MSVQKPKRNSEHDFRDIYDSCEESRNADETQMKRRRNADETQVNTDNNEKKEKNGKNGKNISPPTPHGEPRPKKPKVDYQPLFDDFWRAWPKKVAKADALKAFKSLKPNQDLVNEMKDAIALAAQSRQWQDPKFIPFPATWLRGRRWEDQIPIEQPFRRNGPIHVNGSNNPPPGWSGGKLSPAGEKLYLSMMETGKEMERERKEKENAGM